MPAITETAIKKLALEQGASARQAKQYARHVITAPWFPEVKHAHELPDFITYSDPTGNTAVHNVQMAWLMQDAINNVKEAV